MTMLPRKLTRLCGVEECHVLWFQHFADRGGSSATAVSIMLPEEADKLAAALEGADRIGARMLILTDTEAQAAEARKNALDRLPNYIEVILSGGDREHQRLGPAAPPQRRGPAAPP